MTAEWRRALHIYVSGRNRALTVDEKRDAAGAGTEDAGATSGSGLTTNDSPLIAISVPRTLEYYRNAGTWRNRIEDARQRKAGLGA